MSLLLNWRVWAALALAGVLTFTNFASYRKGKADDRSQWLASVAAANEDARKLQERRQDRADEAAKLAAGRDAAIRADADRARLAASGLRGDIESLQRASADSLTTANNAVRALGDVFEQCVREYSSVAETADRATSEVKTLRDSWPK